MRGNSAWKCRCACMYECATVSVCVRVCELIDSTCRCAACNNNIKSVAFTVHFHSCPQG